MKNYFIGDTHFGHKNIINFQKEERPFESIKHHDDIMIKNWNNTVAQSDSVFVLGDFAMGKRPVQLAENLNGRKVLIGGNHDECSAERYLEFFDDMKGCIVRYIGGFKCLMQHVPCHTSQLKYRMDFCIHGHLHSNVVLDDEGQPDLRYLCVSAEQTDLRPISESAISSELNRRAELLGIKPMKT